jgi:acetoin utilization deacetylase AcuC-like enzyme
MNGVAVQKDLPSRCVMFPLLLARRDRQDPDTMPPKFFFPATPQLPLPDGHRFPANKYGLLRERLRSGGIIDNEMLCPSPPATRDELLAAHAPEYVDAIADGSVDPEIMRRIGLPWSDVLARRSRATVGGTVAAARLALASGLSGQLAGGTHHAHHAFGSGFCTFNDFAVASELLLREGKCTRIAVLDVDVHQGDGNGALLRENPAVLVISIHGEKNFPFRKVACDIDIGLPDGTEDRAYLNQLADALAAIAAHRPDLILYNSGVDPLESDRLGRLSLSFDGLYARDTMVFEFARRNAVPIAIAIGGGYATPIDDSVRAYANTFIAAKTVFGF